MDSKGPFRILAMFPADQEGRMRRKRRSNETFSYEDVVAKKAKKEENALKVILRIAPGPGRVECNKVKGLDVFGPEATQEDMFEAVRPVVDHVANVPGAKALIFTYGQSGSGKSHTMMRRDGIVARTMETMYEHVQQNQDMVTQSDQDATSADPDQTALQKMAELSTVEIHNNKIYDLMDGKRTAVTINKWTKKKVTLEEAKIAVKTAQQRRVTKTTELNQTSSRGHMAILLEFPVQGQSTCIILADLAGNEKPKGDNATIKEGISINQDLLNLRKILTDMGNNIPTTRSVFRQRTLTGILYGQSMIMCDLAGNEKPKGDNATIKEGIGINQDLLHLSKILRDMGHNITTTRIVF